MADIYSEEPLTSTVRPATLAFITVRIIKSFPYRTIKNHVLKNVDLTTTTAGDLLTQVKHLIATDGGFRAYRNVDFDTIKIYTKAHGTKSMNLVINFEHDDDWVLDTSDNAKTLEHYGIELSVFNKAAYEEFKLNPVDKWE